MDGSGDNQLTVRYNRRPVNRRVQIILQDYQRWEQPAAAFANPNVTLHGHANGIALMNQEFVMPMRMETEADDSGFESGSESDLL